MVRSGTAKVQSSALVVEPHILTCFQLLMLNPSTGVGEVFDWLYATANTNKDEEEVTENELVEGSYYKCSDSTVYGERGRHR